MVELIVRHPGKGANRPYLVRWFGYLAKDDTIGPPENIPTQVIARYRQLTHGIGLRYNIDTPANKFEDHALDPLL